MGGIAARCYLHEDTSLLKRSLLLKTTWNLGGKQVYFLVHSRGYDLSGKRPPLELDPVSRWKV
jgi:hypothetical protein